jgi:hypothetical protein
VKYSVHGPKKKSMFRSSRQAITALSTPERAPSSARGFFFSPEPNARHRPLPRRLRAASPSRRGPDGRLRAHARHRAGRRAGIAAALGFATGCIFHTTLAAVGIAALIRSSELAFDLVRYAGAAYLVWIGIQALRHRSSFSIDRAGDKRALGVIFRQSVLGNMLNPKVTLFFLAFLPQFVNTPAGPRRLADGARSARSSCW